MRLSELIEKVPGLAWHGSAAAGGDPEVTHATDDSRRVGPGSIFIARPGQRGDGASFIPQAIARGAVAIAASDGVISRWRAKAEVASSGVRWVSTATPARSAALMAHAIAGWPGRSMKQVGVTGTNGKTTTATLTQQILAAAEWRCGLIGTVSIHDGVRSTPATLTTPDAESIVAALSAMRANGCRALSMEVSSHALDQERNAGLDFDAAIFTNLTGDHLDYHGTMEHYAAAKARLFASLRSDALAIVNAMDPWHRRMLEDCSARVILCEIVEQGQVARSDAMGRMNAQDRSAAGLETASPAGRGSAGGSAVAHGTAQDTAANPATGTAPASARLARASVEIHEMTIAGAALTFRGPWGEFRASVPFTGRHNAMNALQAIAAAHAIGLDARTLQSAVTSLAAPPGRLEPITAIDAPFQVFVDYAHTDDALQNVLSALRPLVTPPARLRVVFGCGGDRDPTKRPRMGRVACAGADLVTVTSDNPRSENPEAIIDAIMQGVEPSDRSRVERQVDRALAIDATIRAARPGDVVVIAGKGHENYQIIGGERRHFDDGEAARESLVRLGVGVRPARSGAELSECAS
ncbi:MAG: UDP-N-acetylmuramoyl-L-alanyl-D-glutamate--2,6-diaminopimelate ligase [Phycisphaeraceae bacterium]|nr:UDP-N-acetylmuramoyl-L-alanyl-D-glutamate--2,6-diaminopimelate ligase [Phycisphaeraceae bacterium]